MRLVRLYIVIALWTCLSANLVLAADELTENDLYGDWVFPENNSVIRTYRCSDALCVKIVSVVDKTRRDIHNPNPKLRNRPIAGIVIASNFRRTQRTSWRGDLYSTLDGITYRGTINLLDKKRLTMVGCIFEGLFCEAKTFYRTNAARTANPEPAQPNATPGTGAPVAIALSPPLPERMPAEVRSGTEPVSASIPSSEEERTKLFEEFLAWREKQSRDVLDGLAERATQ